MSLVSNAGKTALHRSGLSNYIYKWNYTRCSLIKKATPNRGAAKLLTLLFPSTVSRHFPFPLEQRDSFQDSKTFRNSFRFRTKILEKGKIVAFIFLRAKIPPISLFCSVYPSRCSSSVSSRSMTIPVKVEVSRREETLYRLLFRQVDTPLLKYTIRAI